MMHTPTKKICLCVVRHGETEENKKRICKSFYINDLCVKQ